MKTNVKKWIPVFLAGLFLLTAPKAATAESASNYCYEDSSYRYFKAPAAYEVEKVYYAADFPGMDDLGNLASMYVTKDAVYITSDNAILIVDHDFQVTHILSEYKTEDGKTAVISNPDGIFVKEDGTLYVCEPDNGHILVFDRNFKFKNRFGKPKGLDLDVAYKPSQIVVDSLGRMYVIASNVYEGILELSAENAYQRYFGTTTVTVSPLEVFFRMIASEEQLNRQSLLLPTEYSSMALDSRGFIYTTIRSTDVENPVRLLNVNGDDILPEDWRGDVPVGDVDYNRKGAVSGPSSLNSIDCNEYGMYLVLDSVRKRIFTYDEASNMLFVFGGSGDKDGCFRNPVSVRWLDENNRVIVADRLSQSVTVMKPTNYAGAILSAAKLEHEGERDAAIPWWKEALAMNANCAVAKDAIGRALYWEGDYESAMEHLKELYRMDYYSMAFEKIREKLVRAYAPAAVSGAILLIAVWIVFRRVRRKRKGGSGYAAEEE